MCGSRIRAAVFSFSILLAAAGGAQSYRELDAELRRSNDAEATRLLLEQVPLQSPLRSKVNGLPGHPERIDELRAMISRKAKAESSPSTGVSWPERAKAAKARNPLYRDDAEKQSSNWLAKAYEQLGEALRKWLEGLGRPNVRGVQPPSLLGPWIVYLFWGLLGALLLAFLYFVIRHFSWKRRLTRKAKALLDEDEPERTLDEWLTLADRFEAEGRFREAVRCLYLACLLKFDEHHVARFDRGQTNWEHLGRISQSPQMPAQLDFTSPTRAFDRVWYGMFVEGKPDVDRFRSWYTGVVNALKGAGA